MKTPKVSAVIPAYNEEKDIGSCLSSLQKQSYPKEKTEIIVVDDGSTDKTRDIVKTFSGVKLINGLHKGPGISRNLGAKKAKGEILVFVDADMTFDRNYVTNLIKPVVEGRERVTEDGVQIASNPNNVWSKCWGQYFKLDPSRTYGSTCRAISRKLFLELGGFDSRYGYMDDKTFFLKYKIKSFWVKDAICYHKNPGTLEEVYRQSRWIGSSMASAWFDVPIIKYFAPFAMALFSPIVIPALALRKSCKIKNFRIFFPWMLIFMSARYAGTLSGIFRKIYFRLNVR